MTPFEMVHQRAADQRRLRDEARLPIAHQRGRIAELEGALRGLIKAGDGLRLPAKDLDGWHAAALAAEGVLNATG